MVHTKELLYTLLCHTCSNRKEVDENVVIRTAILYMNISWQLNSKNNAFQKVKGIFLQSCGLTETGVTALAKMGEIPSMRTLSNLKTVLAIEDEVFMRSIAEKTHNIVVMDNLDKLVNKTLTHKTLPVILSRKIEPSLQFLDNNRKSLDDTMQQFNIDYFLMNSQENDEDKEAFLQVL